MIYLGKGRVKDMFVGAEPELFRIAREYRKHPTKAEQILWEHLRKFRSEGFVFRRQHPVVFFIADFYCHKARIVVEVDGGYHSDNKIHEYDENRSGELDRYGIKVIRFKNEEIISELEKVISRIRSEIDGSASPAHSGVLRTSP